MAQTLFNNLSRGIGDSGGEVYIGEEQEKTIDSEYQGFFGCHSASNQSRLKSAESVLWSLIDIGGFLVLDAVKTTLYQIPLSLAYSLSSLVHSIGYALTSLLRANLYADYFKEKTISHWLIGLDSGVRCFSTLFIGIPAFLLWKVVYMVANILGVFCPEIGRRARLLDRTFASLLSFPTKVWIEDFHQRLPVSLDQFLGNKATYGMQEFNMAKRYNCHSQAERLGQRITEAIFLYFNIHSPFMVNENKVADEFSRLSRQAQAVSTPS